MNDLVHVPFGVVGTVSAGSRPKSGVAGSTGRARVIAVPHVAAGRLHQLPPSSWGRGWEGLVPTASPRLGFHTSELSPSDEGEMVSQSCVHLHLSNL